MFDLSVKDKPRSPFGKLKDKMKGRRQYDLESASAIVSSSSGALEEDFGLGGKKAKGGGGFFFKNKLRKSSLTQSSTSLGSDITVSSASSMVGLAASETEAAPSPGRYGSLPADHSSRDFLPSPKATHKRAFSDEVSKINTLPESRSVQSLKPQSEPISRSSLCINGSHIYCEEPSPRPAVCPSSAAPAPLSRPKKPVETTSTGAPAPEAELPPWSGGGGGAGFQRPPQKDPPRFIPSPPILAAQEEDKLSVKTLALSKQRSRAKMEEAAHTEGRPIQIAMPMVFSAGAGRGRPPEDAQEEDEPDKAGLFCRGSTKEDAGKSRVAESGGRVAAVPGPAGEKSSSWFSMKDAQDPSQRPSSPSGLPAATDKDTCVCEDRGPPAFLRAGPPQPGPAPPSVSAFEPAAAASPPVEWGDPFDALASSRLRPGAQREPLPHWDAASEGLAGQGPPTEEVSPPHASAGLPRRWSNEPEGSPGVAPQETVVPAKQPWGTCTESSPGHSPCEEKAISGLNLNWSVVEAKAADPWGEAWPALAAGTTVPSPGSEPSLGQASEGKEKSSPTESRPERPAVLPLETSLSSEAEAGQDAARQEPAALQMPPAPGQQPAPGEGQLPEEASQPGGGAGEERGAPAETWEPRGEGRQRTDSAPPKPPRRFTPLSLEEAAGAGLGGAQPRCESQEGPRVEADGQGPPVGEGSTLWVIGAGDGSVVRGAQGLLPATTGNGPAGADELTRQEGSLGDLQLPEDGGAKQPETCPGKPGLAGGEPLFAPSAGLSSLGAPGRLPMAGEGGLGPSGAPQGLPAPSPPVFFWTALEEQLLLSQGGVSPEQPRSPSRGTSDLQPSLVQGGGVTLPSPEADRTGSQSSWGPPAAAACSQGLAGSVLRPGPRGSSASDSELSSSWSDDRVVDFKKADFWQAERGEESSVPGGNPFVSRLSPQNNPFVERPPEAPPALQASPVEGSSFSHLHAGTAPQGLLPAPLLQGQPGAPFPHDSQPLAFSTPSLEEATSTGRFDLPSPIVPPAPGEGSAASNLPAARLSLALPSPSTDGAASSASPVETPPADEGPVRQNTSPHLVKPIRPLEKQRRSSLPLSQEKLKPKATSGNDSATLILPLEKTDLKREPSPPDCSAKYYHLTHDELIQLLLKREAELSKKQEHVRELENYIDRLLVRIMEQSPTLLQVPLGGGATGAK